MVHCMCFGDHSVGMRGTGITAADGKWNRLFFFTVVMDAARWRNVQSLRVVTNGGGATIKIVRTMMTDRVTRHAKRECVVVGGP